MKKKKMITGIALILSCILTLCACSTESVEIGSWKDKLYTQDQIEYKEKGETQSPNNQIVQMGEKTTLPEGSDGYYESLKQIGADIASGINDKLSDAFDGDNNYDSILGDFNDNSSLLDSAIKEQEQSRYTEEENGLIKVKLLRVVDGDTLYVNYKDKVYIRLIGVNTPESVHPEGDKNTQDGKLASSFTKELLKDTDYIWLEFDTNMYDEYDRILAYVWLDKDTTDIDNMLNAQLLKEGQAQLMTVEPNIKYLDAFKDILD